VYPPDRPPERAPLTATGTQGIEDAPGTEPPIRAVPFPAAENIGARMRS
jgi:hypothetical protein